MTTNRGDVVLVLFPDSNLRTVKPRPALVVQANQLATGLAQTIGAMISGNLARVGHPSRVFVSLAKPEGQQTGLHKDPVIMTDNLATVVDKEIDRVIGTFPDMHLVDAALRCTLSL